LPVYANADEKPAVERLSHLLRWGLRPGSTAAFGFSIACVAVALTVRLLFWLFRPDLVIFATYYPAVLLATLIGGWPAGILAQAAGGIVAWLFFDPALPAAAHALSEQMADFGLYGLSSGLIVLAGEHYRRVIRRLDEEEHYRRLVVDELNQAQQARGGPRHPGPRAAGVPAGARENTRSFASAGRRRPAARPA